MFPDLPEGQTNSFQAQVLAVWPDAYCRNHFYKDMKLIINRFDHIIGLGNTEADAWQNAASKLPKGG